jgi:ribonuclease VapC
MVIDTSAIVAILQNEPERRSFNEAIESADVRRISAATLVEVSIVIEARFGAAGLRALDMFLDRAGFEVIAVDTEQAKVARNAYSRFGKGRHPAALNYGDCFSYALASVFSEQLLFKGDDFSQTDLIAFAPRPSI